MYVYLNFSIISCVYLYDKYECDEIEVNSF